MGKTILDKINEARSVQKVKASKGISKVPQPLQSTVTLTFGDCAENHVGMQQIGAISDTGFTIAELQSAMELFKAKGCDASLVDLNDYLPEERKEESADAKLLLVRGGINAFVEADELEAE